MKPLCFAISTYFDGVATVAKLYAINSHTLEHFEESAAALDYQFQRFEGIRERVQALLKRMNNQISLVCISNLLPYHQTYIKVLILRRLFISDSKK